MLHCWFLKTNNSDGMIISLQVVLSESKNSSDFIRSALEIIGRSSNPEAAMEAFSMVPDWVRQPLTAKI